MERNRKGLCRVAIVFGNNIKRLTSVGLFLFDTVVGGGVST